MDLSSQLVFVVTLMDETGTANILHYGSTKSNSVTRRVLASELHSMVHGFDFSKTLRMAVNDLIGDSIPLVFYTDSRSIYDNLVTLNMTTEKRLFIDLHMLRQSYERRQITAVVWIPTVQNHADGFTKENLTPAL